MWKLTTAPEDAPQEPERITVEFKGGLPVKVTVPAEAKHYTDAVEIFLALNALGRKHGIGRIDIVENRFIGVKSRGCYESPGATILRVAHIDLEGLTLDRNVRALRDQFTTVELGRILYNGHFFTPEREFITSSIPTSQRTVNGVVKLKLYKGNVVVEARESSEVSSIKCQLIYICNCIRVHRVSMMSNSLLWTSSVVSSPLTPLGSSKLSLFGSRSLLAFLPYLQLCSSSYHLRWAQANIRKGQAGVAPKDVYGSRI